MSMSRKKMKIGNVATLVAEGVTFNGDIELKGQLIVAGNVNGAIKAIIASDFRSQKVTKSIRLWLVNPITPKGQMGLAGDMKKGTARGMW